MVTIYLLCKSNPLMGPPGPRTSFLGKITSLKTTWVVFALFILVIGGIYLGVFSPTEAAGVGAFGAFIFGLARRQLGWQAFKNSLVDTGKTTAMVFIIILGAMVLGYFLAVSRIPFVLADIVGALVVNRYVILVLILPLAISLGFNPIWFGILITRVTEIGLITPPVGLNVYIIRGVARDVPVQTIFRGIIPFLIADVCHVALLIALPQLSLFLPSFMK